MKRTAAEPAAGLSFWSWLARKAKGFPPWRTDELLDLKIHGPLFGITETAGVTVTPATALQLSTVWACASILGRVMTSFPVDIVRASGGIRRVVEGHPAAALLRRPNEFMTWMEFAEPWLLIWNLNGNGFIQKVRVGDRLVALWPLRYDRMSVKLENRALRYEYDQETGAPRAFQPDEIIHLRNFSADGIVGLAPVGFQRELFGGALAQQRTINSFYQNYGRLGGEITHPGKPGPEARTKLREEFQQLHGGPGNAGKVLLLWEGMTYKETAGINPADAQWMETKKMSVSEIAAIYGVPLNLLGQADKTATYASAEQFNQFFIDYTLQPLAVRLEQALTKGLQLEEGLSVRFNLDALLRGDSRTRAEYLSKLVANGLMTRNEARAKENLAPLDGGDALTVQSNMTFLDQLQSLAEATAERQTPPAGGMDE